MVQIFVINFNRKKYTAILLAHSFKKSTHIFIRNAQYGVQL